MSTASLTDKTAVITGASSGIGKATAKAFAAAGCAVGVCSRSADRLREIEAELAEAGATVFSQTCDVTDEAQVKSFIAAARAELGRIDFLVNNAGVGKFAKLVDTTAEDWDRVFNTNCRGMFLMTRETLPIMESQNFGIIFNISSVAGTKGYPSNAAYCASKWAVRGFTQSLQAEYHGKNRPFIRFVSVCPGATDTGFFDNADYAGTVKHELMVPPEEIGELMVYIASRPDLCYVPEVIMHQSKIVFSN